MPKPLEFSNEDKLLAEVDKLTAKCFADDEAITSTEELVKQLHKFRHYIPFPRYEKIADPEPRLKELLKEKPVTNIDETANVQFCLEQGLTEMTRSAMSDFLRKYLKDMSWQMWMDTFKKFDADSNMRIDKAELTTILHELGLKGEVEVLFDEYDVNSDGKLSFSEFLRAFAKA
mmetsp:Transcript_73956/g.130641  ORF Transcript_73956/g.130641 Transcript_73956/m.130641 type:complete len:174 (-) Transcript_73956:85-606(-)